MGLCHAFIVKNSKERKEMGKKLILLEMKPVLP